VVREPAGPRQYNAFVAIVLAPLFHSGLYRDVARNWRGIAALYLFLLVIVTSALTAYKVHISVRDFARDEFPKTVEDVPPISIRDGVVSSPVEQPYEIVDEESRKTFAVIDTTGTITSLRDTAAFMLLTKNELHYRDNNQVKIQDLSQIKSFDLDREKLKRWMNGFASWAGGIVFVLLLIFVFIYRLIQALIYAAIGLAFAAMFGARLTYQQLIRLSIIAVTPVILLDVALDLAGVDVPFFPLICFAVAMVYLAMTVKANASDVSPPGGFQPVYTAPMSELEGRPMM
jgi:hypothetical protein